MTVDGALLLDKPLGLSSNAALQTAKRLLGAAKAGHAGTLDPLASGLLVLLFGEATKFAGHLLDADKEYLATVKLGERTSTGDAEGQVLQRREISFSPRTWCRRTCWPPGCRASVGASSMWAAAPRTR